MFSRKSVPALILCFCILACSVKAQHNFYNPNPQTANLIFHKPKQVSFAIQLMKEGRINFQAGFSPLKHVSLSAAYMSQSRDQSEAFLFQKEKKAYSFAIGTYYFFGTHSVNLDTTFVYNYDSKNNIKKIPIHLNNNRLWCDKGLLLNLKIGYSKTSLTDFFRSSRSLHSTSEINYDGFYLQLGFAAKHPFGLFGMSYGLGQVNYKKANFDGRFFSDYFIIRATTMLKEKSNYLASTLNIQNQMGFKIGTLVIGTNIRINNFLAEYQMAIEKSYFYGGIILELGEMISQIRKKGK